MKLLLSLMALSVFMVAGTTVDDNSSKEKLICKDEIVYAKGEKAESHICLTAEEWKEKPRKDITYQVIEAMRASS
jgi:intergrase/recombinase